VPLRVDLLAPFFWPEVRRGTERFVHELATGLLADGHRPRLITSHAGRLPSHAIEGGLPIVRVPRLPDGRLRRRRLEDHLTHVPFSYLTLRAGDAEVAHAHTPAEAVAAARWSRQTGRPAIHSYMGVPDHGGLMHRRRRLEITQRALTECAATVALSHHAAQAFERWLGYEARVIHPGVDLESFLLGRERTDEPTIVCPSTLTEYRKRVPLLIEALALVRREHPRARLLLDRPRDERLAERFSAPEAGVELADMDSPGALASLYGSAWATALPSTGEAFGLVLVESLATGTPVVGRADGAFGEIVDRPEVGRPFAGDSPTDLARALLECFELTGDPATRDACRERAAAFSSRRTAEAYAALYAEVVAAGAGAGATLRERR
jgi:phosphatidylinositol alpha-mannosyltransferase